MQVGPATQDRGAADAATPSLATIVGVWAPDSGACSVRNFREGLLPTIINTDGAWAGDSFCIFKNQKQTETGWKVVARCSSSRERWTTDVRLTVKDNRLIWTSKRGTQTYSRCATDFLIAAAAATVPPVPARHDAQARARGAFVGGRPSQGVDPLAPSQSPD